MSGLPGVLLDRDGTLIREVGYLSRVEQLELLPRVPEAIRLLCRHGLKVAVITNQSAVGRGILDEEELHRIHRELSSRLGAGGARLHGIYYCPHHPMEGLGRYRVTCDCRKPDVGLAKRAATELDLDLKRSYVVGDQARDMELAGRIGARGILIRSRSEAAAGHSYVRVNDLWEAANWIIQDLPRRR